jgi:hypothetical protein
LIPNILNSLAFPIFWLTKNTNHIQDTHNQLWSPMSEGGEKPKRLIIYKTHTISYDHLCLKENKNQKD